MRRPNGNSPCHRVSLSPSHRNRRMSSPSVDGPARGRTRCHTHRRGVVLIMALVCLVLVAALGGTLVRWAAMEHKLLRAKEDESQARWLAEAAVERTAAQLAQDADYAGDTWNISATELPSAQSARVVIRVKHIEDDVRRRSIEVDVEYPFESDSPVRIHKAVTFQLSPSPERASQ
jgi:hypothetical protein